MKLPRTRIRARLVFGPLGPFGPFVLGSLLLGLVGCNQERRITSEIEAHPASWNEVSSPDFHGLRVAEGTADGCEGCHGAELEGSHGVPGCFECHDGAGGHPHGFAMTAADDFHGDHVAANGPRECRDCHGEDYRGGWSEVSCFGCHAGGPSGHPDGWMEPRAAAFHGRVVLNEGYADCRRCHGPGLSGGTSGKACGDCHG